jgi:ribosomal protein S18 acetylase RimI-like enzyme
MENVKAEISAANNLAIVEYLPLHQPVFESLNRAWIEKHFWMEPVDIAVLQHPDEHIIKKGGAILVATYHGAVAGTVALRYAGPGIYEFTKMAVDEKFRGKKIGQALAEAAIGKARTLGATKIILYSNTLQQAAIALYRKIGFIEVPVDGTYARANIKMEMVLT